MHVWVRRQQNRLRYKLKAQKFLLYIILFLAFLIFLLTLFHLRISPMIESMAKAKTTDLATKTINEAILERISAEGSEYSDFVKLSRDASGKVTSIESNMMLYNQLKSEIALLTQKKIKELDNSNIGLPIGNLSSSEFLIGRGPEIPINLVTYGSTEVNYNNAFTEAGINQTRHTISIEVKARVAVLLPFGNTYSEVVTSVPVAETVIVGDIPGSYTDFVGTETDAKEKVLNNME